MLVAGQAPRAGEHRGMDNAHLLLVPGLLLLLVGTTGSLAGFLLVDYVRDRRRRGKDQA